MSRGEDQATYDERTLDNIRERNKARIREIDAIFEAWSPLLSKLTNERRECLATVSRIGSPTPTDGACGAVASGTTSDPMPSFFAIGMCPTKES
jgi:hypothetical protein